MLFNLLYFIFFMFVQHISLELRSILLQDLDVIHSVMEMSWNEFIEITQMHELWIDAL